MRCPTTTTKTKSSSYNDNELNISFRKLKGTLHTHTEMDFNDRRHTHTREFEIGFLVHRIGTVCHYSIGWAHHNQSNINFYLFRMKMTYLNCITR